MRGLFLHWLLNEWLSLFVLPLCYFSSFILTLWKLLHIILKRDTSAVSWVKQQTDQLAEGQNVDTAINPKRWTFVLLLALNQFLVSEDNHSTSPAWKCQPHTKKLVMFSLLLISPSNLNEQQLFVFSCTLKTKGTFIVGSLNTFNQLSFFEWWDPTWTHYFWLQFWLIHVTDGCICVHLCAFLTQLENGDVMMYCVTNLDLWSNIWTKMW